jgi:hypothetical protein
MDSSLMLEILEQVIDAMFCINTNLEVEEARHMWQSYCKGLMSKH